MSETRILAGNAMVAVFAFLGENSKVTEKGELCNVHAIYRSGRNKAQMISVTETIFFLSGIK